MRYVVGTSAASGFPIALVGMLGFIMVGQDNSGLPAWSSGYVYWPAFLGIMVPSVIFAPIGAKLTRKLPVLYIKRIFAVFLLSVGLDMLLKALHYL